MVKKSKLSIYILIGLGLFVFILLMMILVLKYELKVKNELIILEKSKVLKFEQETLKLKSQISTLEKNISSLNTEIIKLNSEINFLSSSNSKLNENLNVAQEEIVEKQDQLSIYENKIQTSMDWFKENSILNITIINQRKIEKDTYGECVEEETDSCKVNLGCFFFVMTKKNQLKYYYDNVLELGQEDKLYSIADFLDNKGGDCEDFSLFYKAQLNSMLLRCEGKEIEFKAYSHKLGDGRRNDYFLDVDREWFISNVYTYYFKNINVSSVVCGDMYDLNTDTINGHCMIALTNKSIETIDDLEILKGSVLIEPQTGEYKGIINENSNLYLMENGEKIGTHESSIWAVISNNDYYLYDSEELIWYSYGSIKEKLSNN